MVNVFGSDNIFGRMGNAFLNQGKLGQALSLGQYVANMYGSPQPKMTAEGFPADNKGVTENPNISMKTDSNNTLANQLNPYYPLIAPVDANSEAFRPPPGSGIWKILSLV